MYKLVVFDGDGTLIDCHFIWEILHSYFKTSKTERKQIMEKFKHGRITYAEWVDHDIMLYKEKGANKTELLRAIKDLKLMAGAEEAVTELKERGLLLAVISGSLDFVIDKFFPKRLFDYIYINSLNFDSRGRILSWKATPYDFNHKADGLLEIVEKENISLEETAFVGDNSNDVYITEIAGLSIAFNSKSEELMATADVVIDKKDLREILKYF